MRSIKLLVMMVTFLFGTGLTAQEIKPNFEKEGELIKGTFYYEDGNISQKGTYKNGELHGEWVSYDKNGKKTALASYRNGKKVGKWFFWSNDVLTEVDYEENRIAEVKNYKNTGSLVTRD